MKKSTAFFNRPLGEMVIESLKQANTYTKGNINSTTKRIVVIAPPPVYTGGEIRSIRMGMMISQQAFANLLGVSKKTVEAWESGKSCPIGPARRLLALLEKDSEHMRELMNC